MLLHVATVKHRYMTVYVPMLQLEHWQALAISEQIVPTTYCMLCIWVNYNNSLT